MRERRALRASDDTVGAGRGSTPAPPQPAVSRHPWCWRLPRISPACADYGCDVPLVALDLDGTLVDQAAAAKEWARGFVDEWDLPRVEVGVIAAALTARRPKGEVFGELVDRLGLAVRPEEVWHRYRRQMPTLVRVAEDDRRALVGLRSAGWTLGIVTNGMTDNQQGKIRRCGLDALVDGWVVSETVGVRKPAPEIFGALATRLGCALEGVDGW